LSFFSYVFHGLLCLILIVLSCLATIAGAQTLRLGVLPWTGSTLLYVLFFGALAGLATVLLLLVKGYVFSGYHFSPGEYRTAGFLMVGSAIAVVGAWARMGRATRARR